ncbi:MAG: hypothetical protein J6Q38_05560 [Clostridia bacterium]|nr:hypothetical protein [Clostridia bacterium]
MKKFIFNSGMKIVEFDGNAYKEHNVDFFDRYVENSIRQTEKDAWKHTGFGAQFRGDAIQNLKESQLNENIIGEITSLHFLDSENVNYSMFLNDISALYSKNLYAEKSSESHILHDNNSIIKGANEKNGKIAMTYSDDGITAHLAIFNKTESDYKKVTYGDSFDEHPSFSEYQDGVILFSSKGVGRDYNGNFVEYSPSSILSYNEYSLEVDEIYSDIKYSFIKPKQNKNGEIFAIRKPVKDKKRTNLFLNILLIPFRFLKAIYLMFESFTRAYTGKGFTEKSSNPAKNINKTPNQIFVEGNLIYADKEYKLNKKHKDDFAGIIPRSYELVKILNNGEVEVIKNVVIAYDFYDDNSFIVSNGKYILKTDGVKTEKLTECKLATTISVLK